MASKPKVATTIVLDIGKSVNQVESHGSTFFAKAKKWVSHVILRKIFSGNSDEVTVVVVGSEETDCDISWVTNINVLSPLQVVTWSLFSAIEALKPSSIEESNWIQGLIVGLDVLKKQTLGKKITEKQVILLTNFATFLNFSESQLESLIDVFNKDDIKLILVGIDLIKEEKSQEYLQGSKNWMLQLYKPLKQKIVFTFEEADERICYFQKKVQTPRVSKITFDIGSKIKIPVTWTKFTTANHVIPSKVKAYVQTNRNEIQTGSYASSVSMVTDDSKTLYFGQTPVDISYADMEALKRTEEPCFTLFGCAKREKVNPLMYVGDSIYVVRSIPKNQESETMLPALVDSLIKANKVGIARRILTKNGKVYLGVLLPVLEDSGKHLYFLRLPTTEWFNVIPLPIAVQKTNNSNYIKAVDDFIDSKMFPPDVLQDKGLLVHNPNYQLLCHLLAEKVKLENSQSTNQDTEVPEFIKNLIDPLSSDSSESLQKISELFPKMEKTEKQKRKWKKPNRGSAPIFNEASTINNVKKDTIYAVKEEEEDIKRIGRITDQIEQECAVENQTQTFELLDEI